MTVAKDWEDLDDCPGGSFQGKQRGEHGGEGDGDVWVDKVFHKCGNWSLDLPSSTELLSGHGDPCNSRDRTNAVSWPGRLAASAKIKIQWRDHVSMNNVEDNRGRLHTYTHVREHLHTHVHPHTSKWWWKMYIFRGQACRNQQTKSSRSPLLLEAPVGTNTEAPKEGDTGSQGIQQLPSC